MATPRVSPPRLMDDDAYPRSGQKAAISTIGARDPRGSCALSDHPPPLPPALAVLRGDTVATRASACSKSAPRMIVRSLISMVDADGLEPWVARPWTGFRTGFQSFAWCCLERLQKPPNKAVVLRYPVQGVG